MRWSKQRHRSGTFPASSNSPKIHEANYDAHRVIRVGAYLVTKPTVPLKVQLTQIAQSTDDDTKLAILAEITNMQADSREGYPLRGQGTHLR